MQHIIVRGIERNRGIKHFTGGDDLPRVVMIVKSESKLDDNAKIPKFVFSLFWDYDPESIDIFKHADLIIGRIMERGTWVSMLWLWETYPKKKLVSFLEKRGRRVLSPRELNYWAFISEVSPEKRKIWIKESREEPHVWRFRHAH